MSDSFYAGGGIGLGPRLPDYVREPFPAPEVTSKDDVEGPRKTAVEGLRTYAQGLGWTVLITYARGYVPHTTTGRPGALKESLAVRMRRGHECAVAVYIGSTTWAWDSLWTFQDDHSHFLRHETLGAFKEAIQ